MKRGLVIAVWAGIGVLVAASTAHAGIKNGGVLNDTLHTLRTAAQQWEGGMLEAARSLFWSLAGISLIWTTGILLLRKADLADSLQEIVSYGAFTGFWAWVLENGPAMADAIIRSFMRLAEKASGTHGHLLLPSALIDLPFLAMDRALQHSFITQPMDRLFGLVLAVGLVICMAIVAANLMVVFACSWFVAYAGLIILGFGGSRWTSDMAKNYLVMMLALGMQIMTMMLLASTGAEIIRDYYGKLDGDISLHEQTVLLVLGILLVALVTKVPPAVGGLANGANPHYAIGGGAGMRQLTGVVADAISMAAGSMAAGALAEDKLKQAAPAAASAAQGALQSVANAAQTAGHGFGGIGGPGIVGETGGSIGGHAFDVPDASGATPPDTQGSSTGSWAEGDDGSEGDLEGNGYGEEGQSTSTPEAEKTGSGNQPNPDLMDEAPGCADRAGEVPGREAQDAGHAFELPGASAPQQKPPGPSGGQDPPAMGQAERSSAKVGQQQPAPGGQPGHADTNAHPSAGQHSSSQQSLTGAASTGGTQQGAHTVHSAPPAAAAGAVPGSTATPPAPPPMGGAAAPEGTAPATVTSSTSAAASAAAGEPIVTPATGGTDAGAGVGQPALPEPPQEDRRGPDQLRDAACAALGEPELGKDDE